LPVVAGENPLSLDDAISIEDLEYSRFGNDIRISGKINSF
jgi:hypothetical protein